MDEFNNDSIDSNNNKLDLKKNSSSSLAAAAAAFAPPVSTTNNNRHFTSREVKIIVFLFGIRLLFTGLVWDHFVHKYHDLLMVFSNNPIKRVIII